MSRNEYVDAVLAELDRYGIRGTVDHTSKHIAISWVLPDGQFRMTIVPSTPSDWRGLMNKRAEVRRMLRADNVQLPPAKTNVLTLAHAISTPKPVQLPLDRLTKLESDFEGLFEMLLEAQERASMFEARSATLEAKLASMRVTISFDDGAAVASVAPPAPVAVQERASSRAAKLFAHMPPGQWVARQVLIKNTGLSMQNVSNILSTLRKAGKVELGLRGMWRRKLEETKIKYG
jgi:hypothetical protein